MFWKAGRYLETYLGATVKNGGEEYQLNCRNCNDTHKHFGVNIRLGLTNCFKCGYKPKLFWFFIEKCGLSYNETKELMEYDTKSTHGLKDTNNTIELKLPNSFCPVKDLQGGLKVLLDDWLFTNGVLLSDAENLGFGIATDKSEKYYGRLIIPVYEDNILKTFLARALLESVIPKYLFPSVSRKSIIWGLENINLKQEKEVIICEGWKDAYKVKGIALLGKNFNKEQLQKILNKVPSESALGVMLDKDAWKEGYKLADELNKESFGLRKITLYYIYQYKDCGECKNRIEAIAGSYKFDFSNMAERVRAKLKRKELLF